MKIPKSRLRLASILVVAMLGSLAGWTISSADLSTSGFYFIAIPGTMAALIALLPGTGQDGRVGAFKGTTIAILASAIVLREGFICVLLALPLILPVVALVVYAPRFAARKNGALMIPLLLVGMSVEGVAYDLPSNSIATETRVIAATDNAIDAAITNGGSLPEIEPLFLRLPFPTPRTFTSTGSEIGDRQAVEFDNGSLELVVTERTDGAIRWTINEDTTAFAGWLTINYVDASWVEVDDGLELSIAIDYDRVLAPAIYFDPLQRWGVGEMAEVLADMVEANL